MVGIGVAYYTAAKIALLLAIPPGYATAAWPSAGVALAGVLLFGYHVWPGILLGSFSANLGTWLDISTAPRSPEPSFFRSASAAGQPCRPRFSRVPFYERTEPARPGGRPHQAGGPGGPVSCIVSATVGATSLLMFRAISSSNYLFSWSTWWVGDTIGVLVFTPLVLIWASRPRKVWLRPQISVTVPLCLTFALVVVFFVYARVWEQNRLQLEFEQRTGVLSCALMKSFRDYVEGLHSLENLYGASPHVDRQAFRRFAERLLSREPGIQALSWNRRVLTANGRNTSRLYERSVIPASRSRNETRRASSCGRHGVQGTSRLTALSRTKVTNQPWATTWPPARALAKC